MSVFSSIISKIFGRQTNASPAPIGDVGPSATSDPTATQAAAQAAAPPSPEQNPRATMPQQQPAAGVDVERVLMEMASVTPQKLDWRHSIVDLLKLLGLDSSLDARRELARELHYSGDMGDTATMNVWLHKQVMTKLAENGGRVPNELRV